MAFADTDPQGGSRLWFGLHLLGRFDDLRIGRRRQGMHVNHHGTELSVFNAVFLTHFFSQGFAKSVDQIEWEAGQKAFFQK